MCVPVNSKFIESIQILMHLDFHRSGEQSAGDSNHSNRRLALLEPALGPVSQLRSNSRTEGVRDDLHPSTWSRAREEDKQETVERSIVQLSRQLFAFHHNL